MHCQHSRKDLGILIARAGKEPRHNVVEDEHDAREVSAERRAPGFAVLTMTGVFLTSSAKPRVKKTLRTVFKLMIDGGGLRLLSWYRCVMRAGVQYSLLLTLNEDEAL